MSDNTLSIADVVDIVDLGCLVRGLLSCNASEGSSSGSVSSIVGMVLRLCYQECGCPFHQEEPHFPVRYS